MNGHFISYSLLLIALMLSAYNNALDVPVSGTSNATIESVMLYVSYAFSNNDQPTITKKEDGSTFRGQTNQLSEGDKLYIRNIYY